MGSTKRRQSQADATAAGVLRGFAERIVRLETEKRDLAEDIKAVKQEAASSGFDRKALQVVVRRMMETASDKAARVEAEAVAELYLASLGMLDGTPLGDAARRRFDPLEDEEDDGAGAGAAASSEPLDDTDSAEARPSSGAMSAETIDAAREEGSEAAEAGERVFANPYVAGDPRRAAWDEGWCARKGSDGMEIPEALRRKKKPAPGGEAGEGAEA